MSIVEYIKKKQIVLTKSIECGHFRNVMKEVNEPNEEG